MINDSKQHSIVETREQLVDGLGVDDAVVGEELTFSALQPALSGGVDEEFASMGETIRNDLEGSLDDELIASVLSEVEGQVERLPEVREAGIPDGSQEPARLYRAVADPGWQLYDHLLEVGFFRSVDENAPRFSAEHIRNTGHGLIEAGPLTSGLESVGFDERAQLALMASVVNRDKELSRWVPTNEIPYDVEFEVDFVPPLHQRAAGGALLWIRTLDIHLWQKEILITEEILDDAYWDVRGMLAGLYLLALAASEIADDEDSLTDGQLMAALTGGAAIMIVKQQDICRDVFYITEEMRADPQVR